MRLARFEELDHIKPFDCGDTDLNGFLCDDASYYQQQLLANTFILEDEHQSIAYFCLLNDKISQTTFGEKSERHYLMKNIWVAILL